MTTARRDALAQVAAIFDGMTLNGAPVTVVEGVARPGDVPDPAVFVYCTGTDPSGTDVNLTVEVVVAASNGNGTISDSYLKAVDLADAVDGLLDDASMGGQGGDTLGHNQELDCWVASFRVTAPRTDF